ncbi:hypothetical protein GGS23DRAFT_620164 [Durotheca rogersii]|uniref:uncharacterized protein n=1 Tax=Durotheca rogersii TaxID=419775 RepID=UPI0022204B99|nr:uncharacterized protein GGS23DRAFT_620164 [Durotheca rogersii]KAI5864360.1 hypothetical protein GGS23DRAFT_620164 [Durotheca rogersii]
MSDSPSSSTLSGHTDGSFSCSPAPRYKYLTSFPQFGKLPQEIRRLIWSCAGAAVGEQGDIPGICIPGLTRVDVEDLTDDNGNDNTTGVRDLPLITFHRVPTVFHVCSESRQQAQLYLPCQRDGQGACYGARSFQPEIDVMFLSRELSKRMEEQIVADMVAQVQAAADADAGAGADTTAEREKGEEGEMRVSVFDGQHVAVDSLAVAGGYFVVRTMALASLLPELRSIAVWDPTGVDLRRVATWRVQDQGSSDKLLRFARWAVGGFGIPISQLSNKRLVLLDPPEGEDDDWEFEDFEAEGQL